MDKLKTLHFGPFILAVHFFILEAAVNPDSKPLLDFKASSDKANRLPWNSTSDPCSWTGVSCFRNRVSHLILENLELSGSLEPLSSLNALKLLFLSHNNFSGKFPESVQSLSRLSGLNLSFNNFSGQIPLTINRLTHLSTLRLEGNRFSGPISGLALPKLRDFNVSGNHLSGRIPKSLSGFPESAFAQNEALCGSPMKSCRTVVTDPTTSGSDGAMSLPLNPGNNPNKKPPSSQMTTPDKLNIVSVITNTTLCGFLASALLIYYFTKIVFH